MHNRLAFTHSLALALALGSVPPYNDRPAIIVPPPTPTVDRPTAAPRGKSIADRRTLRRARMARKARRGYP